MLKCPKSSIALELRHSQPPEALAMTTGATLLPWSLGLHCHNAAMLDSMTWGENGGETAARPSHEVHVHLTTREDQESYSSILVIHFWIKSTTTPDWQRKILTCRQITKSSYLLISQNSWKTWPNCSKILDWFKIWGLFWGKYVVRNFTLWPLGRCWNETLVKTWRKRCDIECSAFQQSKLTSESICT
jgi:hypothetical protein